MTPRLPSLLLWLTLFTMSTHAAAPAPSTTLRSAYVGGGCFWCTEAAYELLPGVKSVVSGYAGGKSPQPTYREVCSGTTGHAEVIRIDYDPEVITYRQVIDYFWNIHDPTTLNRQGADEGTQYRSIILTTNEVERETAQASKAAAQASWGGRIVTEIVGLEKFYEAEKYHQDYFRNNPHEGYCRVVIKPKIDKLKKAGAAKSAP
ncbi:MAG: peptide-methionine (S)-S-oxide reductase MsrA [Opitutaceae bacterium]